MAREELDESDDDEDENDPSLEWQDIQQAIWSTMRELGGKVHPKLNWSAPKDATWIAATNSMECATPNDIYLLLKSSDFVTHDLEQAFEDCEEDATGQSVPYHLVLRKSIPAVVTSMEFRCFVRERKLVGICQRDLNHYAFLSSLVPVLQRLITKFFDKLKSKFPDQNFVFDVYIPQPKEDGRVWLIDINPWAPRTDPLLFSWLELLTMDEPVAQHGHNAAEPDKGNDEEEVGRFAEFRIVNRDDPEAYSFNTPLYSAHKLPKDVVDASAEGSGGIRDFIDNWEKIQADAESGTQDDTK